MHVCNPEKPQKFTEKFHALSLFLLGIFCNSPRGNSGPNSRDGNYPDFGFILPCIMVPGKFSLEKYLPMMYLENH